jgi:hypothetical protein
MSALASIQAPFSWQPAIELGNRVWAKKVLPIGEIDYQGRRLTFDRSYLAGLVSAWQQRAYDQVPIQLADAKNTHTNDPERTRGWVTGMELADDGLWITAELTPKGEEVIRENPQLGVSARIVEQYQRADGRHFPAAIQHVLATLDPRLNGLGAWSPVDMANDATMIIDLSGSSFPGDSPPAYSSDLDAMLDGLSEVEQLDLLGAVFDAEAESAYGDGDELTDEELDAIVAAAEADGYDPAGYDAMPDLDAALSNHYATELARQQADEQDRAHPVTRDEDIIARAVQRIGQGTYTSRADLAGELTAIEMSNAAGLCGPADPFTGTCQARYHALGCTGHAAGADGHAELAYGGDTALDVLAVELSNRPAAAFSERDQEYITIPQHTVELASALNESWGLHSGPVPTYEPDAADLFSQPRQMDAYSAMAGELGRDDPASPQLGQDWPDVSAWRTALGL